eukprot:6182612-Pleurochrysis_carterae.AAC.1
MRRKERKRRRNGRTRSDAHVRPCAGLATALHACRVRGESSGRTEQRLGQAYLAFRRFIQLATRMVRCSTTILLNYFQGWAWNGALESPWQHQFWPINETQLKCSVSDLLSQSRVKAASSTQHAMPVSDTRPSASKAPASSVSLLAIGDSHMRELVAAACGRLGARAQLYDASGGARWCARDETPAVHLSYAPSLTMAYRVSRTMFNTTRHAVRRLGRLPDAVLIDSLHWDVYAQLLWRADAIGAEMRAHFASWLFHTKRDPLPPAVLDTIAREYSANCTRYMRAVQGAFAQIARERRTQPPLLLWATTQRSISPEIGISGVQLPVGTLRCQVCDSTDAYLRLSMHRADEARCCSAHNLDAITSLLNTKARAAAAATAIGVVDIEQMLGRARARTYLWDMQHLHHNVSAAIANL